MMPSGTSLPTRALATVRILPSPPPTTMASSSPRTTRCLVCSAAERNCAPGRNSMTAEIPCLSNADMRTWRSVVSPWRSMVPADVFKSTTTLSRLNARMGWVQGNTVRLGQPSRRVGRLDPTSLLEPCHQYPAAHRPGSANAPASENIGGIMNTEINSAHTDEQNEKYRD